MKNLFFFILGGFFTIMFFSIYSKNEEEPVMNESEYISGQPMVDENIIVDRVIEKLLEMGVIQNESEKVPSSKSKKRDKSISIVMNQHVSPKNDVKYFELSTHKGLIKLYIAMPKDEVKSLLGIPKTTEMHSVGDEVYETFNYMGRNRYIPEFTLEFVNGKMKSYDQQKGHKGL